jgi:hypothetical protein
VEYGGKEAEISEREREFRTNQYEVRRRMKQFLSPPPSKVLLFVFFPFLTKQYDLSLSDEAGER